MAEYFVESTTGSDANDGLSKETAKATLAGALAVVAAGERIKVSKLHAETQATAMTLTSPGTAAAPVEILCIDFADDTLATGATVTTTGASPMGLIGFATVGDESGSGGITFRAGTGASTANIIILNQATTSAWRFNSCVFELLGAASNSKIIFGSGTNNAADQSVTCTGCTFVFSQVSQTFNIRSKTTIRGGAVAATGTVPTVLLSGTAAEGGRVRWIGVDLSAFVSGKSLVSVAGGSRRIVTFEHCKLGAAVALTTGTNPGPGGPDVFLDNCDSGDTQTRMQRHQYEGDVYSETTIVRTGGASNGTTPFSRKMVSSAGARFTFPLYGPDMFHHNAAVGSAKTVTVEIVHDSVTALTDAEVWLEVEYLGTAGFPLSLSASDRKADILATAADQTASSIAWTTTGITDVNKQKLAVTFTPQEIGVFRARVALAKASTTIYVDPLQVVS